MFPLCPRALANKGKIFLLAITKKAEPSLLLKSIGLAYEDAIIVANLFDADEQTLARFGLPPGASNTLIAMWAAEAPPTDKRGDLNIQFQMQARAPVAGERGTHRLAGTCGHTRGFDVCDPSVSARSLTIARNSAR